MSFFYAWYGYRMQENTGILDRMQNRTTWIIRVADVMRCIVIGLWIAAALLGGTAEVKAQDTRCGIVDGIDYPVTLVEGYDDFALYRARFGGQHTGIDVAFNRWGDPVMAAARGEVTYSNPEGWDTEKGVIIVRHTFPDFSTAYTLYGHVEATDAIQFPEVGDCVERGEVITAVGWPSRGRPHLHYEIRTILPDDGGPGYVTTNPLEQGWYHPLDFTQLWRAKLMPGFIDSTTFDNVGNLPPVQLDSGLYVQASGDVLRGLTASGDVLWSVQAAGIVTGLAALPGDRIAAHTREGQALVLQGGRYAALWNAPGPEAPFAVIGETLIFAAEDGGLAAFDPTGMALWQVAGAGSERVRRVEYLKAANGQAAYATRLIDGYRVQVVDGVGTLLQDVMLDAAPALVAATGGWRMLAGTEVATLNATGRTTITTISPPAGRGAALALDNMGGTIVYLGGTQNTLMALDAAGAERWRVPYPGAAAPLPPLMATGSGCLLYTLDMDGMLNVLRASDGALFNQVQLYAGGEGSGRPSARMLEVDSAEHIQVGGGFLTTLTLNGIALAGEGASGCLQG